MEKEVFVELSFFKGDYKISNYGNVLSLKNIKKPFLLSQKTDKDGYKEVGLWLDGVQYLKKVHHLVAIAFISNPDCKKQINHIDFNRSNNNYKNLEWSTPKDDAQHRKINNRFVKGEKHYAFWKNRGASKSAKLVLDTESGIFYDCVKDAAEAKCINYSTLKGKLNNNSKNNTSLIYV